MTPDVLHMARALALAGRGRGTVSPNPMVGVVIVDDEGVVVGRGSHAFAGGPHAEVVAIADAGSRARGATLYCTLEPCSHFGRTPPCAPAVVSAGIRTAVIAMEDPNPLVSGRGIAHLRAHGVDTRVGLLEEASRRLNGPFISRITQGRPLIVMKVALSADGRVGRRERPPLRLTGVVADRRVHRDRAEVDAIGIGSGTLLADDPRLTPRGAFRRRPLVRVVFDRRLRTPASSALLSTMAAGPVIIVTTAAGIAREPGRTADLTRAGAALETFFAASAGSLETAVQALGGRGVGSLTIEGGPALHQAFWDAGLVDRVQMYRSPLVVGPDGIAWFTTGEAIAGSLTNVTELPLARPGERAGDLLIEGDVHRTH